MFNLENVSANNHKGKVFVEDLSIFRIRAFHHPFNLQLLCLWN